MKKAILVLITLLFSGTALAEDNFSVLLSEYQTKYAYSWGPHRNRAKNVEQAAKHIQEFVISPQGHFSFNKVVGPRTEARGFREAPVLVRGKPTDGMGGGVCQVATTLHAAVFFAGLEIVEKNPHSRVSHYIRPGLDATVSISKWSDDKDLTFTNQFDFPVKIVTTTTHGKRGWATIKVEVFGARKVYNVRYKFQTTKKTKKNTIVRVNPKLKQKRETVDKGSDGIVGRATRIRTNLDTGEKTTESHWIKYSKNDKIIEVRNEKEK